MNENGGAASRIGFVGVGRMGANMARRLRDVGCDVTTLYDAQPSAATTLATELGCEAAASLDAVVHAADVIFTVVSDDAAMRAIFADGANALLADARGRIFINCATVSPAVHEELAPRCRAAGARMLEACMASSIPQARDGELYLIVAGDPETFAATEPLLRKLAKSVRYVGATGSAARVKALVNMTMNANTCALAEGLGIGEALGIDLTLLREIFAQTGADSRVLETDGADMQAREHETYFSAAHASKDSHIAIALAREAGLRAPVAEASAAQFDRMIALGLGELDKSGIAELTFAARAAEHRLAGDRA